LIKESWSKVKSIDTPLRVKIVIVLTGIYLLNPIDLIPDFIPVLGQLDDIVVLSLAVRYIKRHTDFDVRNTLWGR
jgi:uncharacterized membrane protein YkvA (DUF1232 family)